jgi:glutamyl-tRNA reductase
MRVALIGCNHRSAPVELRERVAFTPEQAARAAEELRLLGILEEAVVVSTCNRSELYGVPVASSGAAPEAMESFFAGFHKLQPEEMNGRLYRHADAEAVRHLFRVASGLDSMLLVRPRFSGRFATRMAAPSTRARPGPFSTASSRVPWKSASESAPKPKLGLAPCRSLSPASSSPSASSAISMAMKR